MNDLILVVEDHKDTCLMLTAALGEGGYLTHCVGGVQEAKHYLENHTPSLVVLDIRLPDGSGLEVCAWVREHERLSGMPVIALTGQDELEHKKSGFAVGVDQYLTKPIVMEELLMWVKALLRRVVLDKRGGSVVALGDLELDSGAQIVRFRSVRLPSLTRREFGLLFALVKRSPGILSRKEILSEVWRTVAVENLVDTHMFNLRNKLPPGLAVRIQSVAGKGFRYFDPG